MRKRAGTRAGGRRWRLNRRWRRVVFASAALFAVGVLAFGALVAYAALTLPDINSIGRATGTIKILDVHGNVIAEVGHLSGNQKAVTIDQISPLLQQATIAAEDRNFYNEGAFNPVRILKAVVDDVILRRPAEGASTITQQLAKQAFFGADAEKSPLRKIKEAMLANELDSKYTKKQILQQYLNITYYGENAYGIESAANRYFNKHAKDLNLMESAMLAGLPEAPSYNDPYQNPDAAYARMHYVLGGMVTTGAITQAQAGAVDPLVGGANPTAAQQQQRQQNQATLQADLTNGTSNTTPGPAPHFAQYVQDQLQQIFSANPELLQGSLVVNTTLDLNLQALATQAVQKGVASLSRQGANNGALLMIDPNTGNILAMVGSANFSDNSIAGQYNITLASRRPGSSFKPYVYEEGFREGVLRPDTILQDTAAESAKLGGVQDFDRRFQGPISAATALVHSRNVAAEQAMQVAGVNQVIDFAYGLGINQALTPQAANVSTAIGTSAVRMIDHTSAYAAFANGGHKVVARGILKISDGSGNVLRDYTQAPDLGTVMTPAQAWTMTAILRNYAHYWGLRFKWDTAGKSGTTDNFVDAYYMTYTPSWVVAVWVGHTDGSNPAEQGMNQVFGTAAGAAISVPFVNSLPKPAAFVPVSGSLPDCASADASFNDVSACPSPTPSPSPSASAGTSPSGGGTPPPFTLPPVTPTPSASASGSPSATPTTAASAAPTAARRATQADELAPRRSA
ncbi:MAG: transglycosylase domain-containing protein [Candidatus Dormibacteria bacterium]